jgi:hypothetical protein
VTCVLREREAVVVALAAQSAGGALVGDHPVVVVGFRGRAARSRWQRAVS